PKDKVPVGAVTSWEDLENRRPRTNIYQGEPILDGKLLSKGQTNDPIQGVPKNMRLKTVAVDARKSAAGLLSPGDRVDVQIYVNRNEAYGIVEPVTRIFLQNIRVYAIDQTIEKSSDGEDARSVAKTVSLVVTPAQANKITLAENMGEVSLIPRHPDDEGVVDDAEITASDVLDPSSANSRKKEQQAAASDEDQDEGALAGIKSLMEQAMAASAATAAAAVAPAPVATTPPWEIEIIYPTEVAHIQFEGGRPVNTETSELTAATAAAAPTALVPNPIPVPTNEAEPSDAAAGAGADAPTPFPIDFQAK
ncbi:MAG TPA: Flp pilus assembly protein CpaB, partial [Lacipirellulaceae bacterium]|nr:Flp pilus assembly protein CpaB [Lacipirellulaceae bacterium]